MNCLLFTPLKVTAELKREKRFLIVKIMADKGNFHVRSPTIQLGGTLGAAMS
jgi:hypothetical protein